MKHLRLPALLLALCLLLGACGSDGTTTASPASSTEQPAASADPLFDLAGMPRLDGSTANIPLATLLVQRTTGCDAAQAEQAVNFTKTTQAYERLAAGLVDFLLVYEGQPTSQDVPLEKHAIGSDALVFLTGAQNPVESLTAAQIRDIYQGKVQSWAQVGGQEAEMVAYQRNVGSGSQNLMEKLVMQGLPMADAPEELQVGAMGELINQVAEYQNGKASLGYSVYYYVRNMYQLPGVKLLAVDGVAPGNTTIADGSYPFTNAFYAVIRADEPAGSPVRQLLEWVLSPEGTQCIKDAGYTA
ncbi:MAG: substrate-binding domain-containing protein [Oscillospiraceae bacterium]|jgi:phosphate transport system substrate-binding protein|nr:substrate-binding domain-containing protein [Oscillospiraceae bacterium]